MTRPGNRIFIATSFDNKYFPIAITSTADNTKVIDSINRVFGRRNAASPYQWYLSRYAPAPPKNGNYTWKELDPKSFNRKEYKLLLSMCYACYYGTGKLY